METHPPEPIESSADADERGVVAVAREVPWEAALGVAAWSLVGNAARRALAAAGRSTHFFEGYAEAGPNGLGCLLMGLVVVLLPAARLPRMRSALGVGFCGSLTTYSGWINSIVFASTAGGGLEELLAGLTIPWVCFVVGQDIAHGLVRLRRGGRTEAPSRSARRTATTLDRVWVCVSVVFAVGVPVALAVALHEGRTPAWMATELRIVVLAPLGALPRFLLSIGLNARWALPVGTWTANVAAVVVAAAMETSARREPGKDWYEAVAQGICGALSTVSSLVAEVCLCAARGERWMGYVYLGVTLLATLSVAVVVRAAGGW